MNRTCHPLALKLTERPSSLKASTSTWGELGSSWRGVGVTKFPFKPWHLVPKLDTFWTNQNENNTRNTSRKRCNFPATATAIAMIVYERSSILPTPPEPAQASSARPTTASYPGTLADLSCNSERVEVLNLENLEPYIVESPRCKFPDHKSE